MRRRSDWWLSGLATSSWHAPRRTPNSSSIEVPAAPQPGRQFGPGYALARLLVTPLYHVLWRVRVEGAEHLPRRGAAIIAANHLSFFDSVVLIMASRRTLSFVGKAEYLESWKTRRLLPALGMIPVDRAGGRRAILALKLATRILRAGGCSPSTQKAHVRGTESSTVATPVRLTCPSPRVRRSCRLVSLAPTRSNGPDARAAAPFELWSFVSAPRSTARDLCGGPPPASSSAHG